METRFIRLARQPVAVLNRASLSSYAMRRLKQKFPHRTEKGLRAKLAPGGDYHDRVVEGGRWWNDWQEDIAELKKQKAAA